MGNRVFSAARLVFGFALAVFIACVGCGCNDFKDSYVPTTGQQFPESASVQVVPLGPGVLESFQAQGYNVIGTANFTTESNDQKSMRRKATEFGKKQGADVVLVRSDFGGMQTAMKTVTTSRTVSVYNYATGQYDVVTVDDTAQVPVQVPVYNWSGVFLRR